MTPFLTNQACAILNYKCRAEAQDIPGVPNCTAADVQRQLELLFYDNPNNINDIDFDSDLSLYETFTFGDCSWRVRKRVAPIHLPGIFKTFVVYVLSCLQLAEDNPLTVGTTKGDRMFERGATLVRCHAYSSGRLRKTYIPLEDLVMTDPRTLSTRKCFLLGFAGCNVSQAIPVVRWEVYYNSMFHKVS